MQVQLVQSHAYFNIFTFHIEALNTFPICISHELVYAIKIALAKRN